MHGGVVAKHILVVSTCLRPRSLAVLRWRHMCVVQRTVVACCRRTGNSGLFPRLPTDISASDLRSPAAHAPLHNF